MKHLYTAFALALLTLATQPNHAQTIIASDNAGNAAYDSGWNAGSNGGTGFQAWSFSNNNNNSTNVFAGNFKGSSVLGTNSFGLYANPAAAFVNADRAFSTALAVGNTFSINLGVNFDNGNKGLNLYSGGTQLFNFNVGSGAGVSAGTGLTLAPGLGGGYDYGGDATLSLSIKYQALDTLSYSVSRSSPQGIQGVLFQGLVTGTFAAPDNFRLYVSGTDDGNGANNLYANNLQIIPEPSTPLLMGLGLAGLAALRRARKTA